MFLWILSWIAIVGEVAFGIFTFGKRKKNCAYFALVLCAVLRQMHSSQYTFSLFCRYFFPVSEQILAAGLYYLAELVEEYSVIAKRVITYLLVVSTSMI